MNAAAIVIMIRPYRGFWIRSMTPLSGLAPSIARVVALGFGDFVNSIVLSLDI